VRVVDRAPVAAISLPVRRELAGTRREDNLDLVVGRAAVAAGRPRRILAGQLLVRRMRTHGSAARRVRGP